MLYASRRRGFASPCSLHPRSTTNCGGGSREAATEVRRHAITVCRAVPALQCACGAVTELFGLLTRQGLLLACSLCVVFEQTKVTSVTVYTS